MNMSRLWYMATAGFVLMVLSGSAHANLLNDWSFENGIDPLPSLGSVVSPMFNPGFWGAELGGEVTAERGVIPFHGEHMLYMQDEGLLVTQTFQAVDVSSYASDIDAGNAVADFRAWLNTYIPNQVFAPALYAYTTNGPWGSDIGSMGWNEGLDASPNTWQLFAKTWTLPAGTRWLIVQLGYVNDFLPDGERAYVDAASLALEIIPEPATLTLLATGLLAGLRRRRR